MQPAPTMTTSYEPSAFAAEHLERERGHEEHEEEHRMVPSGRVFLLRCCEPFSMLKRVWQSSSSIHSPPTKAPRSPWTCRSVEARGGAGGAGEGEEEEEM
eukprot:scaffold11493_cov31-Tisochrysis_lutea.AAC.5